MVGLTGGLSLSRSSIYFRSFCSLLLTTFRLGLLNFLIAGLFPFPTTSNLVNLQKSGVLIHLAYKINVIPLDGETLPQNVSTAYAASFKASICAIVLNGNIGAPNSAYYNVSLITLKML